MLIFDRQRISSKREYTDEGFLKVPARISRIGIQNYTAKELGLTDREPNAIVRVYRPEVEVFNADSLSSFSNKPITNNHPPELVNTKNFKKFTVGFSGADIVRDGMFVKADLMISDADAISNVEGGKVELSNGYTADIELADGVTPEGEEFDAIQKNIRGNHIAIVEKARAGSSCRVADNQPFNGDNANMKTIVIDGVEYEVSDQVAQAVGKLQTQVKDAEDLTEEEEKAMKAKAKEDEDKELMAKKTTDSLQAKLDDALTKIPDPITLDSMVSKRTALIDSARKVCPQIKWEGKDAEAIRKEVVQAKCSNVKVDDATSDYIEARFDLLVEGASGNSQQSLDDALGKTLVNDDGSKKDTRTPSQISRDKFVADSKKMWENKESK